MRFASLFITGVLLASPAAAVDVAAPLVQTGGFYASGGKDNSPAFQNYFVGYGTSPGGVRTAERRSFFVFDIPALPPGMLIAGATLKLRLPFGGLIFGKGPGDPAFPPVPDDSSETFSLGLVLAPPSVVLSPSLGSGEVVALFSTMDDIMVASPTLFMPGMVLPPPGDGGPPIVPIMLDGGGLAALTLASGGSIVLSGWMPSWSEDLRPSPSPPPVFFEASELIFGLTDAHTSALLMPSLVLSLAPVPEAPGALLLTGGLAVLAARGRRRR